MFCLVMCWSRSLYSLEMDYNGKAFIFSRTIFLSFEGGSNLIICLPVSSTGISMSSNLFPHKHTCLSLSFGTIFLLPHPGHLRTLLLPDHLPRLARGLRSPSIISIA